MKRKKIGHTEFVHNPEDYIQFLKAENQDLIAFGRGSLAASGTDAIPLMVNLITNEQEDVIFRRRAGEVLTLNGALIAISVNRDPRAIDALRQAAEHCDSRDRNTFHFVLSKLSE